MRTLKVLLIATLLSLLSLVVSLILLPAPRLEAASSPSYDVILRGGHIVDGTGNPWFDGDLAINADRIAAIGNLADAHARLVLDVHGLVVAPGFIDMLGQSEFTVLADPHVRSKITQGITTELTGEGGSVAPMTEYLVGELKPVEHDLRISIDWTDLAGYARRVKTAGSAINFAHLVGATQVRMAVLKGENRPPTADELERMKGHVARAMEQGAFGLSTSLIYPPAAFADTRELVELAKVASRYGGFYATHIRGESDNLIEAIREAEQIGQQANIPVEVWHFKSAGRRNWGRISEAIREIEAARQRGVDITADMYPYPAAATDLSACLPPTASEGGLTALVARLKDPAARAAIRGEIENPTTRWENLYQLVGGAEGVLIAGVRTEANRKYQGKRLSEVAASRGADPIDTLFDLLVDEGGSIDAIYFMMDEADVRTAMAVPWVAFDCDAPGVQPDGLLGEKSIHPRAYGTFARVLGRYVRQEKVLGLEDAVRKMTSLPARRIGLQDRGLLRAGSYADVTVFDPLKVIDLATFEAPHQFSQGIVHVFVNGRQVIDAGKVTANLPGRVLQGPGTRR
ncbi:MAG TPA: D-aminoacylase [Patescibacteria group bacterium]|nr:D-aminoacylase [Patescibacteria group bacterium]